MSSGGQRAPLLRRQRLEESRIDDDAGRPVKCADEVLARGEVDGGLATDRRVHLADERRRHGHPVDAAQEGRRRKARRVGRAASSERDECAAPRQRQLVPELRDRIDGLRRLADRKLVRRDEPVAECELRVRAVDACDDGVRSTRG